MGLFIKDGNSTARFLDEYSKMIKIQTPFIWEMAGMKSLFFLFFACGAGFIVLKTIKERVFPFEEAKGLVWKLALISLLFPLMFGLDTLMNGLVGSITEASINRSEKGKVAKYAAIELLQTSNLERSIIDSSVEKIHAMNNAKIDHNVIKEIVRGESKKKERNFIENSADFMLNVASDVINQEIMNPGAVDPYNGSNSGQQLLSSLTLNPLTIFKNGLSGFLGYFDHLIRWVVLLVTQVSALVLVHLMVIALMLSFLPFFSGVLLDLIKNFIALKFIPAILAIIDYIFDTFNIMNLSINAIGNGFVDAGMASIGYSVVKIILTVSCSYLSFMLFKAKANPFFSGTIGEVAGKVGGVMNMGKNTATGKMK